MTTLADLAAEEEKKKPKKTTLADLAAAQEYRGFVGRADLPPAQGIETKPEFVLAPGHPLELRAAAPPAPARPELTQQARFISGAPPAKPEFTYAPTGPRSATMLSPEALAETRGIENAGQVMAALAGGATTTGAGIADAAYGIVENLINTAKGPYPASPADFAKLYKKKNPQATDAETQAKYLESKQLYEKTPLTDLRAGANAAFEEKAQFWRDLGPASDKVFQRIAGLGAAATELPFMLKMGLTPWLAAKGYGQAGVPGMLQGATEGMLFSLGGKLVGALPKFWQRAAMNGLGGYALAKSQGASDEQAYDEAAIWTMLHLAGEAKPFNAFKGAPNEYRFQYDRPNLSLISDAVRATFDAASDLKWSTAGMLVSREVSDRVGAGLNKVGAHLMGMGLKQFIPIDMEVVRGMGGWSAYLNDPKVRRDLIPQLEAAREKAKSIFDENGKLRTRTLKMVYPGAKTEEIEGPQGKATFLKVNNHLIGFNKEDPTKLLLEMTPKDIEESFPGQTKEDILAYGPEKQIFGITRFNDRLWQSVTKENLDAMIGLTGAEGASTVGHELMHHFLRFGVSGRAFKMLRETSQTALAMNGENPARWQELLADVAGERLERRVSAPYERAIALLKAGKLRGVDASAELGKVRQMVLNLRDKLSGLPDPSSYSDQMRFAGDVIDKFVTGRGRLAQAVPNIDFGLAEEARSTRKGGMLAGVKAEARSLQRDIEGKRLFEEWRGMGVDARRKAYYKLPHDRPLPPQERIPETGYFDPAIQTVDGRIYWAKPEMGTFWMHDDLAFYYGIPASRVAKHGYIQEGTFLDSRSGVWYKTRNKYQFATPAKRKPIEDVRYSYPGKGKTTVTGPVTKEWKSGAKLYEEWRDRISGLSWDAIEQHYDTLPQDRPLPPPPEIKPGTYSDVAIQTKQGDIYFEDTNNRVVHQRNTGELLNHYYLMMKLGIPRTQVKSRGAIENGEYRSYYGTSRFFSTKKKPLPGEKPGPPWNRTLVPSRTISTKQALIRSIFQTEAKGTPEAKLAGSWMWQNVYEKLKAEGNYKAREIDERWNLIKNPEKPTVATKDIADAVRNVRDWFQEIADKAPKEGGVLSTIQDALNMNTGKKARELLPLIDMMLKSQHLSGPVSWAHLLPKQYKPAGGYFVQATGRIDIEVGTSPRELARRIIHEAMHAITLKYGYRMDPALRKEWFDLYERAVADWDEAAGDVGSIGGNMFKASGNEYGYYNLREFMAELTNNEFLQDLRYLKKGVDVEARARDIAGRISRENRGYWSKIDPDQFTIEGQGNYWVVKDKLTGHVAQKVLRNRVPSDLTDPQKILRDFVVPELERNTYYATRGKTDKSERNMAKWFDRRIDEEAAKYRGPNPPAALPPWEQKRLAQYQPEGTSEAFPLGKRIWSRDRFMDEVDTMGAQAEYGEPGFYQKMQAWRASKTPEEREQWDQLKESVWYFYSNPRNRAVAAPDIKDMVANVYAFTATANAQAKANGGTPNHDLVILEKMSKLILEHPEHTSGAAYLHELADKDSPATTGIYGRFSGTEKLSLTVPPNVQPFMIVHEAMHGLSTKYLERMDPAIKKEWRDVYDSVVKKVFTKKGHADLRDLSEYGLSNPFELVAELSRGRFEEMLRKYGAKQEVANILKKVIGQPLQELAKKPINTDNIVVKDIGDMWQIWQKDELPTHAAVPHPDPIMNMLGERLAIPAPPGQARWRPTLIGTIPKSEIPSKTTPDQVVEWYGKVARHTYARTRMPNRTYYQSRITGMFEPRPPLRQSINEALDAIREGAGGKLMSDFIDRANPLLALVRQIEHKTGNKIEVKKNPYWAFIGMGGREGLIQLSYDKLRDITMKIRHIEPEFTHYLAAMRAAERVLLGADNPQGVGRSEALQAAADTISQLSPKDQAAVRSAAQEFWKWADTEILARLRDAHVISQKSYERILQNNQHWLPFEKADVEQLEKAFNVDARNHGDDIMPDVDTVIQSLHGMSKDARIKDPWESILKRLHVAVNFTERNKTLLKVVQLRNQDPSVRTYIRRIKPGQQLPPGTGQFGVVINGKVVKYSAPLDIIKSLQTLMPRQLSRIDQLFRAHRNLFTMGTTGLYLPFTIFNIPRDFQMAMITSRHQFNLARWMYGLMNALPSSFGWKTPLYKDYLKAQAGGSGLTERIGPPGGEMGFTQKVLEGQRPEAVKQLFETKFTTNLRGLKNPAMELVKFMKAFTGTFELATRLGVFAPARKNLGPERLFEAGMEARRSTIDFNRGGTLIKIANDFIPFLNASMQAKANMFEALFGTGDLRQGGGRGPFGIKSQDARVAAWDRAMLWMVMPTLGAYFYNRIYHDEEYKKLDEDYKSKFVPIMIGMGKDENGKETVKFVPIPKDDFLRIMTRPIERFLDWAWKKEPVKMQEVGLEFLSNLSPIDFEKEGKFNIQRLVSGLMPPLAKSAGIFLYGKDPYWDKEIVPEYLKGKDPWEQYTKKTPGPYKWMGKQAHAVLGEHAPQLQSPLMLEAAARQSFGNIAASPTPGSMLEKIKARTVREMPTTNVRNVYRWDNQMNREYGTTRLKAERLLEQGWKKQGDEWVMNPTIEERALKLLTDWNNKFMNTYLPKAARELKGVVEENDSTPGGTWQSQYTMDAEEWEELKEKVRQRVAKEKKYDVERRMGLTIK